MLRLIVCLIFLIQTSFVFLQGAEWDLRKAGKETLLSNDGKTILHTLIPKADSVTDSGLLYAKENGIELWAASDEVTNLLNHFSIGVVFKADKTTGYNTIVCKGNRTVFPHRMQYNISIANGKLEFKVMNTKGEWIVADTESAVIFPGIWNSLVMTYDDGVLEMFLNGKKISRRFFSRLPLVENSDPLLIGRGLHPAGVFMFDFEGIIQKVRLSGSAEKDITVDFSEFHHNYNYDAEKRLSEVSDVLKKLQPYGMTESLGKTLAEYLAAERQVLSKINSGELGKSEGEKLVSELREICREAKTKKLSESETASFSAAIAQESFQKAVADAIKAQKKLVAEVVQGRNQKILSGLTSTFGAKVFSSGVSLRDGEDLSAKIPEAGKADLSAARGEYENFQIFISLPQKYNDRSVSIECPVDVISQKQVAPAWGEVRGISVKGSELGPEYDGTFSDMIRLENPKLLQVGSKGYAILFFQLKVAENAQKGIVEFPVTLRHKDAGTLQIPVKLKIRDFTLPKGNTIRLVYSFFLGNYGNWFGKSNPLSDSDRDYVIRFLLSYRLPLNNIYSGELNPSIPDLDRYGKLGLNFCTFGNDSLEIWTEAQLNEKKAKWRRIMDSVKKAGLEKDVYFYSFDEIAGNPQLFEKREQSARQRLTAFHAEYPGVKRLQTSAPIDSISDLFDIWVPLQTYFEGYRKSRLDGVRKKGQELWWYSCDVPLKPYPNCFLGYPANDIRMLMTLSWKYNVKGVLYWCINREWPSNLKNRSSWPDAQWNVEFSSAGGGERRVMNGMGNLLYPAFDGKIWPSLRLENLRDGIEDYEYLVLLKNLVAKLNARGDSPELVSAAQKLLDVPPEVAVSLVDYTNDPVKIESYRRNLGDMIEKIQERL